MFLGQLAALFSACVAKCEYEQEGLYAQCEREAQPSDRATFAAAAASHIIIMSSPFLI